MSMILGLGFERGGLGKTIGCSKAPCKIMEGMKYENLDLAQDNIEETFSKITQEVKKKSPYICLGGDHSITYPVMRAKDHGTGLIVFDAHPDTESDMSPPTHEDYLRMLIKDDIIDRNDVIIIGVRNISKNEFNYLKDNKILYFSTDSLDRLGINEICDTVMEKFIRYQKIHISIDIDVLDPAFAPGTGYKEPGGLSTRELFLFLDRIRHMKNEKSYDIVEVNPDKDIDDMTVMVARSIIRRLIR